MYIYRTRPQPRSSEASAPLSIPVVDPLLPPSPPSRGISDLPDDILACILDHLTPSWPDVAINESRRSTPDANTAALVQMCLASRHFLQLARERLYATVTFQSVNDNGAYRNGTDFVSGTVVMRPRRLIRALATHSHLAALVKEVDILLDAHGVPSHATVVPELLSSVLRLCANVDGIHVTSRRGNGFARMLQIQGIFDVIAAQRPKLRSFAVRNETLELIRTHAHVLGFLHAQPSLERLALQLTWPPLDPDETPTITLPALKSLDFGTNVKVINNSTLLNLITRDSACLTELTLSLHALDRLPDLTRLPLLASLTLHLDVDLTAHIPSQNVLPTLSLAPLIHLCVLWHRPLGLALLDILDHVPPTLRSLTLTQGVPSTLR